MSIFRFLLLRPTQEATCRGGLRAITCQAEKQLVRNDAHREPPLPHLTGS